MRGTNNLHGDKDIHGGNKKMKTCMLCKGEMEDHKSKIDGLPYAYFRCKKCGDEVLTMGQLHEVAGKYREMKRFRIKLNKWGLSLGLRIPQEITNKYKLKDKKEVLLTEEDDRIVLTVN